ncbi:hypothetical protein LJR118_000276 [Acidovorax sp. LjRoot118]|uniref:hypothetical protein n=1 Tax=Acidovorax sp. LjRoot118 TaxID=3342256 RepID=UPI003ECED9D5
MGNDNNQLQELTDALRTALARIDAIENTLGALTMLAVRHMPMDKRPGFAEALAALAGMAEKQKDMASATLLTQLQGAAVHGSGG